MEDKMANDLLVRGYHALPYHLRVLTTTIPALYKKAKKYGEHFRRCLDFLLSAGPEEQHEAAQNELEIFRFQRWVGK